MCTSIALAVKCRQTTSRGAASSTEKATEESGQKKSVERWVVPAKLLILALRDTHQGQK